MRCFSFYKHHIGKIMFNMYMHGGSENHGCEAIIRSSAKILNDFPIVYSSHVNQDIKYGLDKVCTLKEDTVHQLVRGSKEWILSSLQTKLTGKINLAIKYRYKEFYNQVSKGDIFLSVGGDNYCYAGKDILASRNYNLRNKGCRTVLWGCSVEPDLLNYPEIKKDIESFDLITARESISYQALKKVNNHTFLVSDPAFVLDRIDLPLPAEWIPGNMIGINASPLILSNGANADLVVEAYCKLISKILKLTDCGIALIPHVVWKQNDDQEILQLLYDRFKNSNRIVMINDHNCMELKGYIARCRMFVGARTHATIAAYSTEVPTLVLGYSVKSRGIAKDIFGSEEKYVIPVQDITNVNALADGFIWMLDNEKKIREHLHSVIPQYIANARKAKNILSNL